MKLAVLALGALLAATAAHAETYEVKMINRNETGGMPYEPDFLRLAPGDTVKFIPTNPTHNAATMPEMLPAGAKPFKGKIDQEIEVAFTVPGIYGIKCIPHYMMGMVMLVIVGDEPATNVAIPAGLPPEAKKRFEEITARAIAKEGRR
jgi:pseudoazurin